ncbi:alkylation response protein AidB-like acyl-CoA dehydrogenase [Diaminobutyricimonas aerilata]|uniref:Alkylation response protein AidB-like acyl-CoA dehydrogenase n=1 Tax=Diaminobutyricimonas aerilata TaxID=1162967 RepID=A0A2M9CM33_9MICO|nr:acyl-CoA dehydrogenase family protein [Diaminobutyricimonas aerilata]PJJ72928.1 alkylation response protein AidB-like acyl-CoA dehydrogenase [Diaminobutyricimonas aerilata]
MTSTASDTRAARSPWHGEADAAELERWTGVAERVAATLQQDALERDRANAQPFGESRLLKEAGLTTLLDPAEYGGGGAHWESALLAVRILARTDASIAQLLGYHYINSANIALIAPADEREQWYRRSIEGRWLWGDSVNPVDPDLALTPDGDGFRLTGTKRFSTGSGVGDALLINAVVSEGPHAGRFAFVVLPFGHEGVELVDGWDFLGQRLSASNTVRYHDVRVDPEHVLGFASDDPFETLVTPGIQLVFGNLYLGIAQGALEQARRLTNARPNSWFLSPAELYRDDPFVRRLYGELVARTAAVEALADRANRSFDRTISLGHELTAEHRAALEIEIATLKVVSSDTAIDVANRVFEATGSSSAASSVGLDLHWRNIRTHSLHDPVDYKKLEVGAHFLTGVVQPISLYT